MPYRNVYEIHKIRKQREEEALETDPKKIEQIYKSQIPYTPGTREFEERRKLLTKTNLSSQPGQHNSARDGEFDRGIKKSILSKTQNRGR